MDTRAATFADDTDKLPHVLVAVLGCLRLLVNGCPVPVASGSKTEEMLVLLALGRHHRIARAELIDALWPDTEAGLAGQSLNALTHQINKLIARRHGAGPLISHEAGYYRLSSDGHAAVDVDLFDHWRAMGQRALAAGETDAGLAYCARAIDLYRGDLCYSGRLKALNERERLRVAFLDLLEAVAEQHFRAGEPEQALAYLDRLLDLDFLREDAQRLAMRCHVCVGHRSQALRQYRLFCQALADEFDAAPEAETTALFDLVKRDPSALLTSQ